SVIFPGARPCCSKKNHDPLSFVAPDKTIRYIAVFPRRLPSMLSDAEVDMHNCRRNEARRRCQPHPAEALLLSILNRHAQCLPVHPNNSNNRTPSDVITSHQKGQRKTLIYLPPLSTLPHLPPHNSSSKSIRARPSPQLLQTTDQILLIPVRQLHLYPQHFHPTSLINHHHHAASIFCNPALLRVWINKVIYRSPVFVDNFFPLLWLRPAHQPAE
ncbi:hypothetical protein GE09DRAFT_1263249, partial [Coniochaeta sp. 2T2.1]